MRPGDPATEPRERPPSARRAFGQFMITGLAALALVGVGGGLVLHSFATDEAVRDGTVTASLIAHGIVEPAITPALLAGDAAAVARLDDLVRRVAEDGSLARIKIWAGDGTIIYSDERRLIGSVFALEADQVAALSSGRTSGPHISDLRAPENRYEGSSGELLEIYVPVRAADGTPLLVESYLRLDAIIASGQVIAGQFLPVVLVALGLLAVVQWPLAWRLARDMRRSHAARERMLRHTIESSQTERRRIAADLHDGLVQSLAGVSFELSATANETADPTASNALRRGAATVRGAVQEARSLLVDLYPPNLGETGLANALADLGASLAARGIAVDTQVDEAIALEPSGQTIVYRVAQEALRNVQKHARAQHVSVRLAAAEHSHELTIEDDGVGFDPAELDAQRRSGHLGLTVLRDLARDAGASIEVTRRQPTGTTVRLMFGGTE